MSIISDSEAVPEFAAFGVRAFTTTRTAGSFGLMSDEPVGAVTARWAELRRELRPSNRLATASQVHGSTVLIHQPGWTGLLRSDEADGHVSFKPATALAVTIADCVPVFLAHPSGAVGVLHSGWRGTAARIIERGIHVFADAGLRASELYVHVGPAICGRCYEVSPDVYEQLTGKKTGVPTTVDLRSLIAEHARAKGVKHVSMTTSCTRCDNTRFFSHRAGDAGRQLGVIVADR